MNVFIFLFTVFLYRIILKAQPNWFDLLNKERIFMR